LNKYNIININDVVSTNTYALSLKGKDVFKEGLVILAKHQKQGKGQRGNIWESEKGKNIIISIVIEPHIAIDRQFEINKIITVAILDLLSELKIDGKIKWPNDILIGNSKVAGVLIENVISKKIVTHSVIGIGLNVNQVQFNNYSPKATSLKIERSKEFLLNILIDKLLINIQKRVINYRLGLDINIEYLNSIFKKDIVSVFEIDSQMFNGIIRGVTDRGLIIIETESKLKKFDVKEIKMIF